MQMSSVNRQRILKNTLLLYARLLFSMGVSLVTSRIVLNKLGVEDYGIYGLVGGIVLMFSFLNVSMSSATSRFITVSLVQGNSNETQATFRSAMIVHITIALVVFFLAETLGLWFVCHRLNIDPSRMYAAQWVYQLSIISTMLGITQVPYNATLIANERFDLYAWLDIMSTLLKLGAACLLFFSFFDKLILYSIMIFLCSSITVVIARIICIRKYSVCKFRWRWSKSIGKSLLSFSGWNLYSSFCFVARQQGTNILLNIFGSTAVNAAAALATTIQNIVESAATNLITASRPQIISQYSLARFKDMSKLMESTSLLANILYCVVAIPFLFEIHYVLILWLKIVPDYTIPFCYCIVILNFISINSNVVAIGIQADGRIRKYSFIAGTFSLLVIPVVWILFRVGFSLVWAFIIPIGASIAIYIVCLMLLHIYVADFRPISYLLNTVGKSIIVVLPSVFIAYIITHYLDQSLSRIILTTIGCIVLIASTAFVYAIDRETRVKIFKRLKQFR